MLNLTSFDLIFQNLSYVCKDGMKMKHDFYQMDITVKCNANNTFETVAIWPECVSSKHPLTKYFKIS